MSDELEKVANKYTNNTERALSHFIYDAFLAGAQWERERAKVLVDTLECIEAGFPFDFDGAKASTHASLALDTYRGEK